MPESELRLPPIRFPILGNLIVSFYAIGLYGGLRLLRPLPDPEEEAHDTRVMQWGILIGTGLLLIQPMARGTCFEWPISASLNTDSSEDTGWPRFC